MTYFERRKAAAEDHLANRDAMFAKWRKADAKRAALRSMFLWNYFA